MKKRLILFSTLLLAACAAPAQNQSQWAYDTHHDKLRQYDQPYAFLFSDETYQFKFPYAGGSKGILQIARFEAGYKVALGLSRGHIDCKIQCDVPFSFDNGPVQNFAFAYESQADKTLIVPVDSQALFNRISAAKTVVAEVSVTSNGPHQFTFATSGLDLAKLGPPAQAMNKDGPDQ